MDSHYKLYHSIQLCVCACGFILGSIDGAPISEGMINIRYSTEYTDVFMTHLQIKFHRLHLQ